jgi:hypothetical protein
MTFIASVVAKEGVAIIADSLVTTMHPVLESNDFQKYLDRKIADNGGQVKVDLDEILKLFKVKPSHTKDYEDKLFQYGKWIAVTTAGSASINGKRIKRVIADAEKKLKPDNKSNLKSIDAKVEQLKDFVAEEVKKFLQKNDSIDTTVLIVTGYSRTNKKAIIYKLTVVRSHKTDLEKEGHEFVSVHKENDVNTVICDGQNKLSERLLFGDLNTIMNLVPKIAQKILTDFNIPGEQIPNNYLLTLLRDNSIVTQEVIDDVKMFKLRDLSLQQAVDLASLLMRIEIDIQKYTENIPSVGGVIKLAVIDADGFRYIAGHEIVKHETF